MPFYLHKGRGNVGIITDANRAQIGSITPEGDDYWRDQLTGRVWNSPIAAAHTYLLARAPDPPNESQRRRAEKTPQPDAVNWTTLRLQLETLLCMPSMDATLRVILRKTIRQIDTIRKDESE
jgi:hypothetical protein